MNIAVIGGAGFIGTNLIIDLAKNTKNRIMVIDRQEVFFGCLKEYNFPNVSYQVASYDMETDFDELVKKQDVIYHLASTIFPGTSNRCIPNELESNVIVTAKLLDSCVKKQVKRVIFVSSGGTVYGKKGEYPIVEDTVTYPISSYGIQKMMIEKMLYLYRYQYGLDYRVIRLANPYGPYQRPNGGLGVVTAFVYHALTDGILEVYGDGSIVRDFIYIDDAIRGIRNIAEGESDVRIFNLGSGKGTSINDVVEAIRNTVCPNLEIKHIEARATDVKINYLDIQRYESIYGALNPMSLEEGIKRTAAFLTEKYCK